jgi:ABC-2 type transport system ATP-binding protein
MDAAIVTEGLTKVFMPPSGWRRVTRGRPTTAVKDVTLSVARGEVFGLLGPNGAGKTTLTKILSTLILPNSGTARVVGFSLDQSQAIRAAVGLVVTDERSFYWRLSARRNLGFFAAMHGLFGVEARARVDEVLAAVEMSEHADTRFSNFSTGMKQRLAIARALLHQPRLLFLDEPSRSLDPAATRRLHSLIRGLVAESEVTIFLITHDLSEAEALCGRVAVMHEGTIRAVGPPETLRRDLQPHLKYVLRVASLPESALAAIQAIVPEAQFEPEAGHVALRFRASERDGRLAAVLATLQESGAVVRGIEGQPPTLEEVFAFYTAEPQTPDWMA